VKYADNLVLLEMAEALLQGMIERLIKIGRIETNVEKKLR
jgi:hypothetical protein